MSEVIPPQKNDSIHTFVPAADLLLREKATNIGTVVSGHVACYPCNWDPENYVRAARCRVLQRVGPDLIDPGSLNRLSKFVLTWCQQYIEVIGAPLPFEDWLESRPYPSHRKDELRLAHDRTSVADGLPYNHIRSFLKSECYESFKDPRLINSRCDEFKTVFGPWCSWMEDIVYKLPMFAKHVKVADRPSVIVDLIGGMPVQFTSDFSRFESSMRPEIMDSIECVVYRYFGVPEEFLDVITGRNHLCGRHGSFEAWVTGTRMSGEMNTSLGNGLTNYLMFAFYAHEHGIPLVGMVEGDDGIYGSTEKFDPDWFLRLGFQLKLEDDKPVPEAGFCRMFWASDYTTMTDLYRLVKVGWSMHMPAAASLRKKRELFGAICLSIGHELGGCPIYWALAKKYGKAGRVPLNWWELNEAQVLGIEYEIQGHWLALKGRAPWNEPSRSTREEYSNMFGLSVGAQLRIEKQIFDGQWFIDEAELNALLDDKYPDMRVSHDLFVQWACGRQP